MATSLGFSKLSKWFSNKRTSSTKTREFEEAFRLFDANGDGKISSEELKYCLSCFGEEISLSGAQAAMKDFDLDDDGLLDYEEFLRLVKVSNGGGGGVDDDDDDLKKAFEMMEVEKGAGCITACGLKRMMRRLGEEKTDEECAAMIRAFDLDGNGVLDYYEFLRMMS
ncbi:hypothetical protein J5N97_022064 [Dioscorea zingiberensis]|uniref:EF-hand domain-containing protein n=1 Tax=Dioscorea zingiberensis TaxID=325984 RepID=A0A9D5C9T1_9LILI|nr:hypothetical protein J5N97_022064 [Dioscorea zingiberensis]